MTSIVLPIVLASLAGSLHCAVMCGPFMAAVAGFGTGGRAASSTHVAYHLGRLTTYLGLGAAGGLAGGALDLAGRHAGVGRISALVAGLTLVLWGTSSVLSRHRFVALRRRAPRRLGTWLGVVIGRVQRARPFPRAFVLGLATTLVPCGWLYAFVATAAGTGQVLPAVTVMLAFWVGTVPALVAAGVGLQSLTLRLRDRAPLLSGALILASGVLLLALRIGGPHEPAAGEGSAMPASCPLHGH